MCVVVVCYVEMCWVRLSNLPCRANLTCPEVYTEAAHFEAFLTC